MRHWLAGTLIIALHIAFGRTAVSGTEILYGAAEKGAPSPADILSYRGPNDRIENNLPSSSRHPAATPAGWDTLPRTRGKVVDWQAFMRGHDMVFDRLPRNWTEAPHFGNAMIGSMLYQDGNALKLQIFRADVHDHRDDT